MYHYLTIHINCTIPAYTHATKHTCRNKILSVTQFVEAGDNLHVTT